MLSANPCLRVTGSASVLPELRGNLSGFGLGSKSIADVEKVPSRRGLELGEEESARKKLERLPTPPLDDADGKANEVTTHGAEDDDDETMEDVGTEEEAAAVARAAAEKREERLQSQGQIQGQNQDQGQNQHQDHIQHSTQPPAGGPMDVDGNDVAKVNDHVITNEQKPRTNGVASTEVEERGKEEDDDEEEDPLDAFMSGLSNPADGPSAQTTAQRTQIQQQQQQQQYQQQPETLFGDDEVDLKTMDTHPGDILALAASKARKKKDLPAVNHSKMKYGAFRKTFYTEPTELATMTDGEVADLRLELDGVKIRVSHTFTWGPFSTPPQTSPFAQRRHRVLMSPNRYKNGPNAVWARSRSMSFTSSTTTDRRRSRHRPFPQSCPGVTSSAWPRRAPARPLPFSCPCFVTSRTSHLSNTWTVPSD